MCIRDSYQSETDFKFAGLDQAINKMVMGHRDASGWHVDEQSSFPGSVKADTFYNMLLSVNGTTATLVVNNRDLFSHTFQPRVIDGITYSLNWGLLGVGSNQSRGSFDNVTVQVLPPEVTYETTLDFQTNAAPVFGGDDLGEWNLVNGTYIGTPETGLSLIHI